jgi:hypothetical protein
VRLGIIIAERLAGLGGTPTLREVGGGDVDSCAWMWPSTLGIDITAEGNQQCVMPAPNTGTY